MKHQKEWYTCDRCGKEMTFYEEKREECVEVSRKVLCEDENNH